MRTLLLGLMAFLLVPSASAQLVVTGVFDGPLSGGTPKAIEFYATEAIPDLAIYGFGSANNGGGTDGEEFTFSGSATEGQYLYVASETQGFTDYFGFAPTFDSGAAGINGDDAIEVFKNGAVIDVFGDINTDGTGEAWDHVDGWAYRTSDTGPDGTTFVVGNWSFSGTDAIDGCTTNASCASVFPIGTYTVASQEGQLIITGVFDGPLSGGTPKVVELYATGAIADLSTFTVANYNNGGTTISNSAVLSGSATAGQHIYVTRSADAANFQTYFGIAPTLAPGDAPSINGDDAVAVLKDGTIVDAYGVIGTDGTGEVWEHLDGWAYRNDGTSGSATFSAADWTFSGVDATDGCATNAGCASVFPIGTYAAGMGGGGGGTDTRVQFALTAASVAEGSGEYNVEITIINPSANDATTFEVAVGGDAERTQDYMVTGTPPAFTAGSSASLFFSIDPIDDQIDELDETVVLTLTQVMGGTNASVGTPSTFTLTLVDAQSTEDPTPITIETARALPDGDRVLVRGVFSRVKGAFAYLQDGSAGIALRQPSGSFQDQITSGAIVAGDSVEVLGTLSSFNGLKQFNEANIEAVRVLQKGVGVPAPLVRTLTELTNNGEALESRLVRVEGASFSETGTFAERSNYTLNQNGATFTVRVANAADTDVDGVAIPSGTTTVTGILSQFNSTGVGGYQLLPIRTTDIGDAAPLPPTVRFVRESATVREDAGMYTFRVELNNASPTEASTVDVSLTGGTATNGADIATFNTRTLTFPANATMAQEVTLSLTNDRVKEDAETLIFTLSNASATIGTPSTFTLTIVDSSSVGEQSIFIGESGETLQNSIRTTYTPNTLGYNTARDQMYGFVWNTSGTLPGIYTGLTISVPANPSTARSNAQGQGFNAEHLWPQSQGAGEEPARSDLYNLAPTVSGVNSDRGNLPFGTVSASTATDWYRGSTKQSQTPTGDLGLWSRRNSTRFEPRDEFKGDIARSQFYFYTIYKTQSNASYWNAVKDVLYQWHQDDPVSTDELTRHDRIAQVQGKDNPYVLDATLVGRAFFGETGGGDGGGETLALSTIADARVQADGSRVRFRGVVTRARGTALYLEDGTAGLNVRQFEGELVNSIQNGTVVPGDSVEVIGSVSSFNGLKQVFGSGFESIEVIAEDAGIRSPLVVTASELNGAFAESLESRLLSVEGATFVQTGTFEANRTYQITSNGTTIDVRFGSNADDSDLVGTAIPTVPVTVTGVLGQFDRNSEGIGFQLLPIETSDIATFTSTPEELANGELDVRLFPLPARDALTIALSQQVAAGTTVEIVDLMGRIVQRTAIDRQSVSIPTSALSSGVYLMRLTTADGSVSLRRSFTVAR